MVTPTLDVLDGLLGALAPIMGLAIGLSLTMTMFKMIRDVLPHEETKPAKWVSDVIMSDPAAPQVAKDFAARRKFPVKCPSCLGPLAPVKNQDRIICTYCGAIVEGE